MRMIPGERDRGALTQGPSSAFGGTADGALPIPEGPSTMDAVTTAERQKEGGGASSQRRPARKTWKWSSLGRRVHELW